MLHGDIGAHHNEANLDIAQVDGSCEIFGLRIRKARRRDVERGTRYRVRGRFNRAIPCDGGFRRRRAQGSPEVRVDADIGEIRAQQVAHAAG